LILNDGRTFLEGLKLAHKAVETAAAKSATDIVLLDVKEICTFADYFILCSAESGRQINAVTEEIEHILKQEGERPIHREGTADSGWVLLDYADVVIHTFAPEERQFYNLEELWSAAKTIVRIQ
jgi:ribosome-associated protein